MTIPGYPMCGLYVIRKGHGHQAWHNRLRSTGLHVFGPFLLYASSLWYEGPILLKHTPAGVKKGLICHFLDLKLRLINPSDLLALAVILST